MSPAMPVPVRVGVVTLVMSSPCAPLSLAADSTGADGAAGAAVLIDRISAVEAGETLPAASV